MDSLLRLPALYNWAKWASVARDSDEQLDIAENWRLLWSKWLTAYSGSPAGKTTEELEIEVIGEILDEFSVTRPRAISLYDYRVEFYRLICAASSITCQGLHLDGLINAIMRPGLYLPLKFTDGDNLLFHCGFNGFTLDEVSGVLSSPDTRKPTILSDGTNVFMGLRSPTDDAFTWAITMPTLADFSKLTIRWVFSVPADSTTRIGPTNGNTAAVNGAFDLLIQPDNKIRFAVNNGAQHIIESDAALLANTLYEVWGVIDSGTMKMYVDGVLQADTEALGGTPAFETSSGIVLGSSGAGVPFQGVNYELAIHGDTITP
jgi:hypothetical protein